MISILQIIIILFIPVFMVFFAITRKRDIVSGESQGLAFRFRKRVLSEQEHKQVNLLYCNIILSCGINIGLVSFIFSVVVLIRFGPSWIMCITFVLFQLIVGFASSYLVARALAGRLYIAEEIEECDEDDDEW